MRFWKDECGIRTRKPVPKEVMEVCGIEKLHPRPPVPEPPVPSRNTVREYIPFTCPNTFVQGETCPCWKSMCKDEDHWNVDHCGEHRSYMEDPCQDYDGNQKDWCYDIYCNDWGVHHPLFCPIPQDFDLTDPANCNYENPFLAWDNWCGTKPTLKPMPQENAPQDVPTG